MAKLTTKQINQYRKIAQQIRLKILEVVYRTKGPHIGSSFSVTDLLVALYFKALNIKPKETHYKNRDIFILSKGHANLALCATLARRGFFSENLLKRFAVNDGLFEYHPNFDPSKGVEVSSGSLGHGLSIGVGMALAAKNERSKRRVFVLVGDGELDEGSNWEAILCASQYGLDNLVLIVDYNKFQILGKTSEVLNLEPLAAKFKSFGWGTREINGHNFPEIIGALSSVPFKKLKPSAVIAHTIKGKGISFMENNNIWHSKHPSEQEYAAALKELSK